MQAGPSSNRTCRFPASGFPQEVGFHKRRSQDNQSQSIQVLIVGLPFRQFVRSLAPTAQVDLQTLANILIHVPKRLARIPGRVIVRPSFISRAFREDPGRIADCIPESGQPRPLPVQSARMSHRPPQARLCSGGMPGSVFTGSSSATFTVVDVSINQSIALPTPPFLCRGPSLHDRYSFRRYYGLVRLPQVLPCGSPKSLTELSERATPLDPAVCLPSSYRSLPEGCWFQNLRHPDHTNWRNEA